MKGRSRSRYRTTVTIREEAPIISPFIFPKSKFPSPLELFWQEHRHEEKDETRRQKMDEIMEKYV